MRVKAALVALLNTCKMVSVLEGGNCKFVRDADTGLKIPVEVTSIISSGGGVAELPSQYWGKQLGDVMHPTFIQFCTVFLDSWHEYVEKWY
jgi:hypothetical protein